MAVESSIEADDGWFTGEAKTLRYTLLDADDATGWTMTWELRRRRSDAGPVVAKATNDGVVGGPGQVDVNVDAADTLALAGGTYHAVLRRTDVGNEQVLSYGAVVLREVTDA